MQTVSFRDFVRPGRYALTLVPGSENLPERNVRRRIDPLPIYPILGLIQPPFANQNFMQIVADLMTLSFLERERFVHSIHRVIDGIEDRLVGLQTIPQPGEVYTMTFEWVSNSDSEEAGSEPEDTAVRYALAGLRPAGYGRSANSPSDEENDPATTAVVSRALAAFRPGRGGVDLRSPPPGIVPFSGRAYRLD
jgi:hypothetical protein